MTDGGPITFIPPQEEPPEDPTTKEIFCGHPLGVNIKDSL